MSFTDRLVLWLHIAFAIFTIGPVTVAIMSTPRYIRKRNLVIVRYLYRTTRIFAVISLGVLIAGGVLARQLHDFTISTGRSRRSRRPRRRPWKPPRQPVRPPRERMSARSLPRLPAARPRKSSKLTWNAAGSPLSGAWSA